ncbi:MAG: hypothetical protein R6U63_01805 [Longimicrobiales bacterium]
MDAFSEILFHAHSGLRYLVLLAGLLSLSYSLTAALRGQAWGQPGRLFLSAFVGVMDLQVLIGLILVFIRAFYPALWGHLSMMIVAAVVGHVALAINKRRPPERQSHWLAVIGAAVPLILIVGGILSIGRPIF